MKKDRPLTCKFCGHKLVRAGNTSFSAPDRGLPPKSAHTGEQCFKGECLNRVGQITQHHPDSPEFNGGA